ncbi:MRN complex-interacting protein isoform X2 [Pempheris klunzingeri]|uniref:MRN complex-interacting protein isoform X2 n=1 Tax=Pempheris klunzingeri TaxID=3127111 RepID=UPI003980A3F8
MVQEFHVLRCFSCQSFQVQQEFGRGSGADCRRHVQKLNAMRGAMMEEEEHALSLWKQVEVDGQDEPEEHDQVTQTQVIQSQVSRWSKYLDTPEEAEPEEEEEEEEEDVLMDRQQLHGNNMTDRKRKRREGWTARRGQGSHTPEQSNWSSAMMKPVRPSAATRTTSLDHNGTSPPSKKSIDRPSKTSIDRPSKKTIDPPSVGAGSVSRWARFLSSDCQVKEGEEPSVSGRSQSVGGGASRSCISHAPPSDMPRPLLPVSSMFESGEEFSFDDEFLTAERM